MKFKDKAISVEAGVTRTRSNKFSGNCKSVNVFLASDVSLLLATLRCFSGKKLKRKIDEVLVELDPISYPQD